jgi:hypothetical protein
LAGSSAISPHQPGIVKIIAKISITRMGIFQPETTISTGLSQSFSLVDNHFTVL